MGYLYVLVKRRMICQFCWPKVGAHKLKVFEPKDIKQTWTKSVASQLSKTKEPTSTFEKIVRNFSSRSQSHFPTEKNSFYPFGRRSVQKDGFGVERRPNLETSLLLRFVSDVVNLWSRLYLINRDPSLSSFLIF